MAQGSSGEKTIKSTCVWNVQGDGLRQPTEDVAVDPGRGAVPAPQLGPHPPQGRAQLEQPAHRRTGTPVHSLPSLLQTQIFFRNMRYSSFWNHLGPNSCPPTRNEEV